MSRIGGTFRLTECVDVSEYAKESSNAEEQLWVMAVVLLWLGSLIPGLPFSLPNT